MKPYATFEQAQDIIKKWGVRSKHDYYKLVDNHPELNLPPNPDEYYQFASHKEWVEATKSVNQLLNLL